MVRYCIFFPILERRETGPIASDATKLARRLHEAGRALDVMLEVKLSPEQSKAGVAPEELPELVAAVKETMGA